MGKIKITQKQYQAILKESKTKNLKITREQYNRLVKAGTITENAKYINLIIENVDFNTIKNETNQLIKYLYRKTDNLSDFWGKNGLSYDEICKALLGERLIIKSGDKYKLNKNYGEPNATIQSIEELLNRIINKNDVNKNDSEISEDESLAADTEFGVEEDKKPKLKVIAYNEEIAILKGPDSELYTFYYGDTDKEELSKVSDVGGEEVDNYDITKYVNDTLEELSKGDGMQGWEYGDDLVKIDEILRQELINIYDKDPKIIEALSQPIQQQIPEMTGSGSSGAFTGGSPFSQVSAPKDDLITRDVAVVAEDTTVASAGNFQYDTPGFTGIGKNGEFKKAPKTKAQKTPQISGGGFVELDSCTKLNNNKSAQNGGCSVGASDNVVKVKKSSGSVSAPSLKENQIFEVISKKTGKSIEEVIKIIESKK